MASSTSYATTTEADTYIQGNKLDRASWEDFPDAEKSIALIMATNRINNLAFKGEKLLLAQENAFPRNDDSTVPEVIKDACIELAFAFSDGIRVAQEFNSERVTANKFGPVSTTYDSNSVRQNVIAGIPSYEAWVLLLPYMVDQRTSIVKRD